MLKIHKFARRPFYVDAVRVSESNLSEVAEWCDGVLKEEEGDPFISVKVHRPLTERQTQAFVGDWVLFAGSGFKVYVPKAFDKSFEKVKTLTKAQADEAGIKVPHEPRPPKKSPVPTKPTLPQAVTSVGKAIRKAQEAKEAKEAQGTDATDATDATFTHKITGAQVTLNPNEEPPSKPEPEISEVSRVMSSPDAEAQKLIDEVLRQK